MFEGLEVVLPKSILTFLVFDFFSCFAIYFLGLIGGFGVKRPFCPCLGAEGLGCGFGVCLGVGFGLFFLAIVRIYSCED